MAHFKEYGDYDATGLADLVKRREVSPSELLDEALARVAHLNPSLNAVVILAEATARRLIDEGLPEGPFTGVPFLLKDLGAEAVDFPTHNGSRLFANTVHFSDSAIYQRLKKAGLVTFGRTASPECGVGPVTEAQVYGGPTRNPWNLAHTSGGSSGGAGAAVAAGIVPAAHGSDGGGSVRIPAASCGLVGFKPTRARMPEGPGGGEGWAGMSIDGFLTRSLRDTVTLLDATHGPDLGAPYWPPPLRSSYTEAAQRPAAPLRIAVCTTTLEGDPIDPVCRAAVEKTAVLLQELGHQVVNFTQTIDVRSMMVAWTKIVACGTALWVRSKGPEHTLDPYSMEPVTRGALRLADSLSGSDYLQCVNSIHDFGLRMAQMFLGFDVLVTATLAERPAPVGRLGPHNEDFMAYRVGPGGMYEYSPFTAAFNASGQPAISLPLYWTEDGLPIGIHFAAPFGEDEQLISLAAQLEEAADWRRQQLSLIARLMAES